MTTGEDLIERIKQDWDEQGAPPYIATDIYWFELTPLGEQTAQKLKMALPGRN